MDLSKILAITGKPGLYKMVTQTKNGMVVESIIDGKKFTAFSHEKISALEEISIYTTDEDRPLKEVLKAVHEKLEGSAALSHKSNGSDLKAFFLDAIPDYDDENVYVSDIKKVIYWYNILLENELLDFSEEEQEAKEEDKEEKKEEKPETEADEKTKEKEG